MKRILATVVISVALVACGSGGDDSSTSGSGSSSGTSNSGSTSGTGSSGTTGNGSSGSTGVQQPQPPAITTFTANPNALPPGGGDVTLNWAVDGAQTLDLEPGSINVTGLQSWTVTGITANASFRLIATNAAGTSVASASVTVAAPGALTGKVVEGYGLPLAYQHVFIPGHAPTLTALDGTFSVDGVVSPYTLVVSTYDGTFTEIFDQLSDAAPVVTLSPDGPSVASGWVDVGGPLDSLNPDAGTTVYVASAFDQEYSDLGTGSSYDVGLYAPLVDGGSPGVALAVQTITFDDGGWAWDQAGTATFDIPSDGSTVDAGITLAAANPFDVSVNVTGIDPNFSSSLDFGFQSGALAPLYLTNMDLDPAVSSYQTSLPTAQGLTPVVHASSSFEDENTDCQTDSYRVVSSGAAVSLEVAQAPLIASPFPGSSGVPESGATFSWAPGVTGAAYALGLYVDYNESPEPDHAFVVYTHATQFTMPDLSALGLHLNNNSSYYLDVGYISDITSELELAKLASGPGAQDGRKDGWCDLNFFVGEPQQPFFP